MTKAYWVYMLLCRDGSFYIGVTNSIERREWEYNEGIIKCAYTHGQRPVKIMYASLHYEILNAIAWEKHLKGWSRAKKRALINGDWQRISELSRAHGGASRVILRQAQDDNS